MPHPSLSRVPRKPRSKYGAIPTVVDGIRFASRAEAKRYGELKLMEKAGEISNLELQPVYPLTVNGIRVGKYVGDFRYIDRRSNRMTLEDTKGVRTPVYALKKRLVEAIYPGVEIVEVSK